MTTEQKHELAQPLIDRAAGGLHWNMTRETFLPSTGIPEC
jgi:hypothetical protein